MQRMGKPQSSGSALAPEKIQPILFPTALEKKYFLKIYNEKHNYLDNFLIVFLLCANFFRIAAEL